MAILAYGSYVQAYTYIYGSAIACGLFGGILMNSNTVMIKSSMPLCVCWEKCLPSGFSWLDLFMSPKWPTNLSLMRRYVCPTYGKPHFLQVTA